MGSSAGTRAGTPRRRLASSSAMTTLPPASSAASAWPDRALAWANAAASSPPLSRARWRRTARAPLTALDSQPAACAGRLWRHVETSRTATGSAVTGSRTATPAQTHSSNPSHQCSGPLISTGPGASSAVPIPFVPVAHSDQHDHGAILLSRARRSVFASPWMARILAAPSVTVTTPPRLSTSGAIDAAAPPRWANTTACSSVCSADGSSWAARAVRAPASGRRGIARGSGTRMSPPRVGLPAHGHRRQESVRVPLSPPGPAPRH